MFTKNPFNKKDEVADLIGNILESDYKVKKEELKGNQHKIDMNKNNKIDAHDFKLLRSKGGTQKDEEIDPNKVTTDTLKGRAVGKDANPFLSKKVFMDVPDNVKEETEGVVEGLNEMDKTQTSPGRDGDIDWTKKQIHLGSKQIIKAKDIATHGLKALDRTMKKIPKKKGVAEEVEQVDERTLTPGETSEKERIVKGMKKSLAGFKKRYGERAKSVMYATATKAAKKD